LDVELVIITWETFTANCRSAFFFCSTTLGSFPVNFLVRPCVRRNFPNFSFSRVSEKFGRRNLEIFQKSRKNDVKIELRKSQKTRSDLKTDSKVQLKVRNTGPYFLANVVRVFLLCCDVIFQFLVSTEMLMLTFWSHNLFHSSLVHLS